MRLELMKKAAVIVLSVICFATGAFAYSFADGGDPEEDVYEPDAAASKDIELLVRAGVLSEAVYTKKFKSVLRADELNGILASLHVFMGGAIDGIPARVEDSVVTGKKGKPKRAVKRGDAVGALAVAYMTVKPGEWLGMREEFFGFLAENAAAEEPAAAGDAAAEGPAAGESVPAAEQGVTREEMFLLISRMVWKFERDKMEKFAVVPDAPTPLNVQDEEFYGRDVYLYWTPVEHANAYVVKLYDAAEKLIKIVTVGAPVLNITESGDPSFELIFGKTDDDLRASYTVQAVSEYGVKSKKSERVRFTALKYKSARERYGKHHIKYKDGKEGEKHQRLVALNVWRYVGNEKVPAVVYIRVHKKVAAGVEQIFGEYFSGAERFPIQSIGGFAIREKRSEHNYGTAIDINWTENFMVGPHGVEAGEFWDPTGSAYSIADDSELVRAFERHGWYWAGNGWGDTYDYMHFSFMGT